MTESQTPERPETDWRHISEWTDAEFAAHIQELSARDFVDGFSRAAMLESLRRLRAAEARGGVQELRDAADFLMADDSVEEAEVTVAEWLRERADAIEQELSK